MFTGIVEGLATIKGIKKGRKDTKLSLESKDIDLSGTMLGDSISINGICLTVISCEDKVYSVEASHETLSKTNLKKLRIGSAVNIERSLKVGDRLGGHFVTGHIDGTGKIDTITPIGDSLVIWISVPEHLIKYIVGKGSVAVDGVSLTVNEVEAESFSVNIIRYTQDVTILNKARPGDIVNIECDIIGKYVEKFVMPAESKSDKDKRLKELLKGFE